MDRFRAVKTYDFQTFWNCYPVLYSIVVDNRGKYVIAGKYTVNISTGIQNFCNPRNLFLIGQGKGDALQLLLFYKAFQGKTGQTPNEYRKVIGIGEEE